uniref:Uncharacterized protein n=1 Tax=Fagus sylvatica TaxID=28930 RepID=A0A2N9IHR7_FAGSY
MYRSGRKCTDLVVNVKIWPYMSRSARKYQDLPVDVKISPWMSRSRRLRCLFLILAPRPDGSEPPPPPSLSSTTFRSTPQSPDLVLHEGDLMESLGGSSLQQIPSLLSARFDLSGGRRDLLRWWMLDGHRVWTLAAVGCSCNLLGFWSSSVPCVVVVM